MRVELTHEMIVQPDGLMTELPSVEQPWTHDAIMALIGGGREDVWHCMQKGWVALGRDAAVLEGCKPNPIARLITGARFHGPVIFVRRGNLEWLRHLKSLDRDRLPRAVQVFGRGAKT